MNRPNASRSRRATRPSTARPATTRSKATPKLVWAPTVPPARALPTAWRGLLAFAVQQGPVARRDPVRAVHELRKSVRRARALVKLARGLLGEEGYRALNAGLREATAPTSALRDDDVLLALVRQTPRTERTAHALWVIEREAERRVAARRDTSEAASVVGDAVRALRALREDFVRGVGRQVTVEDLVAGLAACADRAQRRYRRARRGGDAAFHDWRKRVKELRYQVELFHSSQPQESLVLEALGHLAKDLGSVMDQVVLHDAASHPAVPGPAAARLRAGLRAGVEEAQREVLERAEPLFDMEPQAFAEEIVRLRGEGG